MYVIKLEQQHRLIFKKLHRILHRHLALCTLLSVLEVVGELNHEPQFEAIKR